jgi:hypothetical protein
MQHDNRSDDDISGATDSGQRGDSPSEAGDQVGAGLDDRHAPAVERRDLWGTVVNGHEHSYFEYYSGSAAQAESVPDAAGESRADRKPAAARASESVKSIGAERKRDYLETLFRGLALRVRGENASHLRNQLEARLLAATGVASGAPLAVAGKGTAEATEPLLPFGALAESLGRLDTVAAQQVEASDALDKYLENESELRNISAAGFIAGERDRLQRERARIVEELDGSIHYALHTLNSDREMLEQELALSADDTPSGVFRKLERALATVGRPGASKRLQELSDKIAAVANRQRVLIDRRDAINKDLSRLNVLANELGFDRDATAWMIVARGRQHSVREEGLLPPLNKCLRDTVRSAQALAQLSERQIMVLASAIEDGPTPSTLEAITDTVSTFLPVARLRLGPERLRRVSRDLLKFFANVRSLAADLSGSDVAPAEIPEPPFPLSSDPEELFAEYSRHGADGHLDRDRVHEQIAQWFKLARARIEGQPEESLEVFIEFLQSVTPAFLRTAAAEEIESFRGIFR